MGSGGGRESSRSAHIQWNLEQTTRRALRSLERRGLVKLGSYYFQPHADIGAFGFPKTVWICVRRSNYVPGEGRIMTGATLTTAGWAVVEEEKAASVSPRPLLTSGAPNITRKCFPYGNP
jgi:hypothetical protein